MPFIKYSLAAAGLMVLLASPAMAQQADGPGGASSNGTATSGQNAPTSSSDPKAQVKDEDVFGYDITMGAAKLTPEQLAAAKNTCNQDVTAEPLRYSPAVKAFCTSIQ